MKKKAVMAFILAMALAFTPMSGGAGAMTAKASNDVLGGGSETGADSVNEDETGSNEVEPSGGSEANGAGGDENAGAANGIEGTENSGAGGTGNIDAGNGGVPNSTDESGNSDAANSVNGTENNREANGADGTANSGMTNGSGEIDNGSVTSEAGGVENDTSAAGNDANGGNTALAETEGKTQLAAPTGLAWGENWDITWDAVSGAEGYYEVELYKDDQICDRKHWSLYKDDHLIVEGSPFINDSGSYKFRVRASSDYDPEKYTDSEWSPFSETRAYTRPSQVLGTTIGYWDSENAGVFKYAGVEGAGGYLLELFFVPSGSTPDLEYQVGHSWGVTAGFEDTTDIHMDDVYFKNQINYNGAGQYRARITALSGNIDKIANGPAGEYSAYFDTTEISKNVSETISSAMKDSGSAADALIAIKEKVGLPFLQTAMQTDSTVLNQIKELEEKYAAEKGITRSAPAVSEEASTYVKAQDVSVVGAGLNVESGEVRLEVSVPEKKEDVSGYNYKDSVQLDISLVHDDEKVHELEVPITITLPIPSGLEASHLVILHYHENGDVETVSPKINGDGTITFTVTSFSTFVFAVEQEDSGDNTGNNTGNNTENNTAAGDASGDSNAPQGSVERVKDDVPKTGDSIPVSVPVTGTVSAGALAVMALFLRKTRKNG